MARPRQSSTSPKTLSSAARAHRAAGLGVPSRFCASHRGGMASVYVGVHGRDARRKSLWIKRQVTAPAR
jgi:hypothetical protein